MKFTGIQHTSLQHFEDEAPYAQHAEFERNERSEDWLSLDNRGKYNLASPKFWSMILALLILSSTSLYFSEDRKIPQNLLHFENESTF